MDGYYLHLRYPNERPEEQQVIICSTKLKMCKR